MAPQVAPVDLAALSSGLPACPVAAVASGGSRLAVLMLADRQAADVVQEAFCGLYRRGEYLADTGAALRRLPDRQPNGAGRRESVCGREWPRSHPVPAYLEGAARGLAAPRRQLVSLVTWPMTARSHPAAER